MKKITGLLVLILIGGCTPTSTIVRSEATPNTSTSAGVFTSQIGGSSAISTRGQSTMQYFVVPPLSFINTSAKQALDVLFAKAGAKYVLEDQIVEKMGHFTYSLNQKKMLDDVLDELFSYRTIMFYIDSGNVYHIKANVVPVGGQK